jgi:hypothetical protein
VAKGFLGNNPNPVVSQEARLSFVTGKSLVLNLFLGRACLGKATTCTGDNTCSSGNCDQPVAVEVNTLLPYDSKIPLLPPDAGVAPSPDDRPSRTKNSSMISTLPLLRTRKCGMSPCPTGRVQAMAVQLVPLSLLKIWMMSVSGL